MTVTTEVTIILRDEFGLDRDQWERAIEDIIATDWDGVTLIQLEVDEV